MKKHNQAKGIAPALSRIAEYLRSSLGILIAAIFPVGALMFLVAFLLIACGIVCLKDGR